MPRFPVGEAAGLEAKAFQELFQALLTNNFPMLAAVAFVQSQLGERASSTCSLEWKDFETDCDTNQMFVKIPDTNRKTVMRVVPLNRVFQEWMSAVRAGEPCDQLDVMQSEMVSFVRFMPLKSLPGSAPQALHIT